MTLSRVSKKLGWTTFAFFAIKGIAWLVLAAAGAAGVAGL